MYLVASAPAQARGDLVRCDRSSERARQMAAEPVLPRLSALTNTFDCWIPRKWSQKLCHATVRLMGG